MDIQQGEGSKTTSNEGNIPWVEKYRPAEIREIVGNEETVQRLQVIANEGNLPNVVIAVRNTLQLKNQVNVNTFDSGTSWHWKDYKYIVFGTRDARSQL
jgi:hypothetical protein